MMQKIITNEIIISICITIFIAQLAKIFTYKKWDFRRLYETGGMPSSHAAFVSALVVSVFFAEGLSTISIVTIAFGGIVIRDALGIRYETGEQAKIINKIIVDLKLEKKLRIKRLRELVGHTATQVQVGIVLGIAIAVIVHFIM